MDSQEEVLQESSNRKLLSTITLQPIRRGDAPTRLIVRPTNIAFDEGEWSIQFCDVDSSILSIPEQAWKENTEAMKLPAEYEGMDLPD